MSSAYLDITVSLDGFAAGSEVSHQHPLGVGGEALHHWIFGGHPLDVAARQAMFGAAGAVVLGRTMFDLGEPLWGETGAFGLPCFVVTHRPRATLVKGPTQFTFVATLAEAFAGARGAAGSKRIGVAGGPSIARQCFAAGLVQELNLHVAPVVLGGGEGPFPEGAPVALTPLAEPTQGVATHWRFAIHP